MTANAEARALLDQLMGIERDALLPAGAALPQNSKRPLGQSGGGMVLPGAKRTKSCYDRDIDPLYCSWGVDVYELFVNTKSDIGPNPYKVDRAARTEYVSLPKDETDRLGFEHRLFVKLQELVQHCDRTVHRNNEKLKRELVRQSQKRGGNDYVVDVSEEKVEELVLAECRLLDMKDDLKEALETLEVVQTREEEVLSKEQTKKDEEEAAKKEKDRQQQQQETENGTTKQEAKDGDQEIIQPDSESKIAVVVVKAETTEVGGDDTTMVIDRDGSTENTNNTDNNNNNNNNNNEESDEPKTAIDTTATTSAVVIEELGKLTLRKQELLCTIATIVTQVGPLEESIHVQTLKLNFVRSDTTTDKTVCEVSGNFMSARDADERIAAHYAGKQYVGWKLVRDKFQELVQKHGRHGPPRPSSHGGRNGGGSGPLLMSHQKYMQQGGSGNNNNGGDRYGGGGGYDRGRDDRGGRGRYGGRSSNDGGRWERGGYGGGDRDRDRYRHDDRGRRGGNSGYGGDRGGGYNRGGGGGYGRR